VLITETSVSLSTDAVLARLDFSTLAFARRSAPALVNEILDEIRDDALLRVRISYRLHDIVRQDRYCIETQSGVVVSFVDRGEKPDRASRLLCASWTLGEQISVAIRKAFIRGRYLHGLVLDEIASLWLFEVAERVFANFGKEAARDELAMSRVFAPGDGQISIDQQKKVLTLAGGAEAGISIAPAGVLAPVKSGTGLVELVPGIEACRHIFSCEDCRAHIHCRLRQRNGTDISPAGHA